MKRLLYAFLIVCSVQNVLNAAQPPFQSDNPNDQQNMDEIYRQMGDHHLSSRDVIPDQDSTRDLGRIGTEWRNAYIDTGEFQTITADTATFAYSVYMATSSGNVGVGTSDTSAGAGSHGYKTLNLTGSSNGFSISYGLLDGIGLIEAINGPSALLRYDASASHQFRIDGAERARIDSSGVDVIGVITVSSDAANQNAIGVNNIIEAWAAFNGTGTPALIGSYNISSITDNGTGDYTLNFSNAMPDTNYACTASVVNITAQQTAAMGTAATGSIRVFSFTNFAAADLARITVICVR